MANWEPTNLFEEEIVNLQPEKNFIFTAPALQKKDDNYDASYVPRPQLHLDYVKEKNKRLGNRQKLSNSMTADQQQMRKMHIPKSLQDPQSQKLAIISQIQSIAATKPIGELPSANDWDTDKHIEKELISQIRFYTGGPCIDAPLMDATDDTSEASRRRVLYVRRHGNRPFPILMGDDFFVPSQSSSYDDSSDKTTDETSFKTAKTQDSILSQTSSNSRTKKLQSRIDKSCSSTSTSTSNGSSPTCCSSSISGASYDSAQYHMPVMNNSFNERDLKQFDSLFIDGDIKNTSASSSSTYYSAKCNFNDDSINDWNLSNERDNKKYFMSVGISISPDKKTRKNNRKSKEFSQKREN